MIEDLGNLIWLLPISLFGGGLYQALSFWTIRKKNYVSLGTTKVYKSIVSSIGQVVMGLIPFSGGLILGDVLGRFVGSGSLYKAIEDKSVLKHVSKKDVLTLTRRHKSFLTSASIATLINRLGMRIPAFLLAYYFDPQVVGWYGLVDRLTAFPLSFIGRSLTEIYIGQISEALRVDPPKARQLFHKVIKILLIVGSGFAVLFALLGEWGFSLLFGAEWAASGTFARIMAPFFLLQIMATPVSQSLNLLEKNNYQLFWDIFRLVFVGGSMVFAFFMFQSAVAVLSGYSISASISFGLLIFLIEREMRNV